MLERQTWAQNVRVENPFKNSALERGRKSILQPGGLFVLIWFLLASSTLAGINLPQYPPQDGYTLADAFPTLTFDQPVSIRSAPGETNRLFVVERTGRIMVITNLAAPTASIFLDLKESVYATYIEAGLLGMAFHPGFKTNGIFFVYRTASVTGETLRPGFYDLVSRFQVSPTNQNQALRESETHILTQMDAETYHNAGDLVFGPDGYLYISVGYDAPVGEDRSENLQSIDRGHFGGILRIDVDKKAQNLAPNPHSSVTENYLVPRDNPFVGVTNYQGIAVDPNKVRTEFFAIGLRNPWRMAFHPTTGALVVGDVGNALMEEINVVIKGGNYGWPYYEAHLGTEHLEKAPIQFEGIQPSVSYWHGSGTNEGNCIIGGVFYFGDEIPGLKGRYLFGDFRRGHVWTVDYAGNVLGSQPKRLLGMNNPTSFGYDPRDREILISDLGNGKLMKLVYTSPQSAPIFPRTLKETGAFADVVTLSPAPGLIPYEINHPFWSDNAIKRRWFWVGPSMEKTSFSEEGTGIFPPGAVWVKHFELELKVGDPLSRRRLETRFLVKTNDGVYGVTYRWDAAGTNATLVGEAGEDAPFVVTDGGVTRTQVWHFPGRAECRACHTDAGGQALGFNIPQLNKTVRNGSVVQNQLELLHGAGYIDLAETNFPSLPALSSIADPNESLHARAKSYLAANCSFCHYGPNLNASWDARFSTPFSQMKRGTLLDAQNDSGILNRLQHEGLMRMPPVSRMVVDTNAVELLKAWIGALPQKPWTDAEIGATTQEGYSGFEPARVAVGGSGTGPINSPEDTFHFVYLLATNNVSATVQLAGGNTGSGGAGLMLRGAVGSDSGFVFEGVTGSGAAMVSFRAQAGEAARFPQASILPNARWLRMTREGGIVTVLASQDGQSWSSRGKFAVTLPDIILIGMSAYNGNVGPLNTAFFEQFSMVSANLVEPLYGSSFLVGEPIRLNAKVDVYPAEIGQIDYFANGQLVARSTNGNSAVWWTNTFAGKFQVVARASVAGKGEVASAARNIEVLALPGNAAIRASAPAILGSWKGVIGKEGYLIPNVATNFPAFAQVEAPNSPVFTWQNPSLDPRAVGLPEGGSAIANAWNDQQVRMKVALTDGKPHDLDFYFVDWKGEGIAQRIEIKRATDGKVLASKEIAGFAGGVHVTAQVVGEIEVVISPIGPGAAALSAVFLDAIVPTPLALSLRSPLNGLKLVAPGPVILEAEISAIGNATVVFYANERVIGQVSEPPYRILWDNAAVGEHAIYARATDGFGQAQSSALANIVITRPIATAAFIGSDDTTKGNWIDRYGTAGYQFPYFSAALPAYAEIESQGAFLHWRTIEPLEELRALLTPDGDARFIAYLMNDRAMTNRINFTDGRAHLFSIYFVDGDDDHWESIIRIKEPDGRVLDERVIADFREGRYLTWAIRGEVTLEIERIFGTASTSGFFIDEVAGTEASIQLVAPVEGAKFLKGQEILLRADIQSPDQVETRQVDFFSSGRNIGSVLTAPFAMRWTPEDTDAASISARAIMADGTMIDSSVAHIGMASAESPARARFVGVNETLAGNWRGTFGASGYWIPASATNLPPFFGLECVGGETFLWDLNSTDPRSLQTAIGPWRIASAVFAPETMELAMTASDEKWRKISFYFQDWGEIRAELIEMLDGRERWTMDSVELDSYSNGVYLTWLMRGSVTAKIQATSGNALLNGVFIDPVSNFEQWRLNQFGDFAEEDWGMAGKDADPDEDGIPNILEYKFGLNPIEKDSPDLISGSLVNGKYRVGIQVNPEATDVLVRFEISTDLENWTAADERVTLREHSPGQAIDSVQYELEPGEDAMVFVRVRAIDYSR